MQDIRTFIRQTVDAYNRKDGDAICDQILLDDSDPRLPDLQAALYEMTEDSIKSTVQAQMKEGPRQLNNFISNYLIFTIASGLDTSSLVDVYELMSTFYGSFLSLYTVAENHWLTNLLMNMSYYLVEWAVFADGECPQAKESKLSEVFGKYLSRALGIVIGDKSGAELEYSKKKGIFYLANLSFKVQFKLRSTRLMPTLIANISKAGVNLSDFPMSQQVTYNYYLGRYHLYQLDLRRAEKKLAFAFRNRPDTSVDENENHITYKNSRLSLLYLTACRLCLGRFPSLQLLQEYDMDRYFEPLMRAVKLGDLNLLKQSLDSPDLMEWFIKKEIYFLLKEKLTLLCWRSLIRRTCFVARGPVISPQLRVHLGALLDIVKALTKDNTFDILDIESIIASLLDQGYIKGYIHSQKKILVLSKTIPFPTVYEVEVIEEYLPQ